MTYKRRWSGREDSNLHAPAPEAGGLPIALRPDRVGCETAVLPVDEPAVGRGGGNRTRISRLMRPPRSPSLPSATRVPVVPPGGLEPPPHGLRARRAALTPRRGTSERGPVSFTGPLDIPSVFKDPAPASSRCNTLPSLHISTVSETEPPRDLARAFLRARPTKKAFQGITPEGLVLNECRASRVRCPPYRLRRSRGDGSQARTWISAHGRAAAWDWPSTMAVLATCAAASWRTL